VASVLDNIKTTLYTYINQDKCSKVMPTNACKGLVMLAKTQQNQHQNW